MPASETKFESAVVECLDAAHNLARWLTRNDHDARDVVQESCMKALRSFDSLRGGAFRPWFLAIVRNTSYTLLSRNKPGNAVQSLDGAEEVIADVERFDPQAIAMRCADAEAVRAALDALPPVWRETLVLREMEGLSYKEIAGIVGAPIGTVMSRLARGRAQLHGLLMRPKQEAER